MRAYVLTGSELTETKVIADVERAYGAGATIWVDIGTESGEDKPALDHFFVKVLALHPLTVEDLWSERTLPKIEDFDRYLFVLAHAVRRDDDGKICTAEIDIVCGPRFVVTHHDRDSRSVDAVRDELARSSRLLEKGTGWVLHALLDHLVDHYIPVFDELDDVVEKLERDVIAKAGTPAGRKLMGRIFDLKRELQHLRRIVAHQRETLVRLSRGEFAAIPKDAIPFFRDVYDHFARITDLAEGYRELVTQAMEAYLSVQSNRMNEVMKTLTLISTVMLPITFVAGVYGMNFDLIPGMHSPMGFYVCCAVMLAIALAIVGFFRYRKWL
ncbi:magnesium/cobalt transporter CorA [soil metagenome]